MPKKAQPPTAPAPDAQAPGRQKKRRGLAALSPERRREIASLGGKAAHAQGTAHEWTPAEATAAGRKGGLAAHAKGTANAFTAETGRAAAEAARLKREGKEAGDAAE